MTNQIVYLAYTHEGIRTVVPVNVEHIIELLKNDCRCLPPEVTGDGIWEVLPGGGSK